jgi:hypothetical protein
MVVGDQIMVARIHLAKGSHVPKHSHINEQVTYILEGALKFSINGREIVVRAGEVLTIPANMPHEAWAVEDTVDLDVFTPPIGWEKPTPICEIKSNSGDEPFAAPRHPIRRARGEEVNHGTGKCLPHGKGHVRRWMFLGCGSGFPERSRSDPDGCGILRRQSPQPDL